MSDIDFFSDMELPEFFHPEVSKKIVLQIFKKESKNPGSLGIIIVNDNYLTNLHKKYMHDSDKTDVITFDLSENDEKIDGEIYISFDRAKAQASDFGTTVHEELYRYLIHGALHLCGYDDQSSADRKLMKVKENNYLASLKND